MAQKIIKFDCWSVKRRVARNKELQGGGEDEQCQQVVNFTGCENFHNLRNSQENFDPPYTGIPATKQDQKLLEVKLEK